MRHIVNLLIFLFSLSISIKAEDINLTIIDKSNGEPIINAHIIDVSDRVFAVTNENGEVAIPAKYDVFKIHAIGYMHRNVALKDVRNHDVIELIPTIIQADQSVMVYAYGEKKANVKDYQNTQSHHTLDRFLDNIDGVAMIQRGAFAWEPSIRGQSDQRMNLNIDGMQIFKACVDKMDPISSYIESNNLSGLKIDKSGAGVAENGNGNSTINLISKKPEFEPFSLDINTGYRYPDGYKVLAGNSNFSGNNTAFQISGSLKSANDYVAGNNLTIENSQFQKMNLNMGLTHSFKSNSSLEVNYITDKAYDVGYPALLMDATKALADILRIQYNFKERQSSFKLNSAMVYGNAIRHWMDDDSRNVAEREVMRNMHMPMYGETYTTGAKIDGQALFKNHQMDWYLNGYLSAANGDMEMISLDPNVEDMLILNIDKVLTTNINMGGRHTIFINNNVLLKLEESIAFNTAGTKNDSYASMFESIYRKEYSMRKRALLSGSASVLWMPTDHWSLNLSSIYSERMGNHLELFGHYIYNYVDGYFYDGNPWLKPERSLNFELNSTTEIENHSLSLSVFHKRYYDYISGKEVEDISNNDFKFKRYMNLGEAVMFGGEFRTINMLGNHLRTEIRASYTYAQNTTLNDPLPQIPPFRGVNAVSYHFGNNNVTANMEWATKQNRISKISSTEQITKPHAIFNFVYVKNFLNNRVNAVLELNNILDTYYREHTSIANIPESGRSVMLSINYKF